MLPAATHDRMPRESMKGKVKGRTHEISRLNSPCAARNGAAVTPAAGGGTATHGARAPPQFDT